MLTKRLRNALDEADFNEVRGGFPTCYRQASMRKLHELGLVRVSQGKTSLGNDTTVWVLTPAGINVLEKG
jgi:hypothetical protein